MSATQSSSHPPRVLLCRSIPTGLLDDAERSGAIEVVRRPSSEEGPAPRQWILDNVVGVDALIVTLTERVDEDILRAAGDTLRIVSSMSVGTDHIDVAGLQKRNIQLGTTPDVLDDAVAELTLLLMLNVTRRVPYAQRIVREGAWKEHPWSPLAFCGPALRGKTVGFVGFGNIAQTVAALLPAFAPARILYSTSKARPYDIKDDAFARLRQRGFDASGRSIVVQNEPDILALAAASDVVVVLTTLNGSTKHLINAAFLTRMKPSAVLVNASRGPVVDTDALAEALRSDRLAGAGLDVLEGEPAIDAQHALLQQDCRDRVMLLPHIGSATHEARQAMADVTARHVLRHFAIEDDDNSKA